MLITPDHPFLHSCMAIFWQLAKIDVLASGMRLVEEATCVLVYLNEGEEMRCAGSAVGA